MKTIRVVAAVIRQNGKIFATQRGYGEWKDGWEFPGGKIEPGETPEEALRREIQEELVKQNPEAEAFSKILFTGTGKEVTVEMIVRKVEGFLM